MLGLPSREHALSVKIMTSRRLTTRKPSGHSFRPTTRQQPDSGTHPTTSADEKIYAAKGGSGMSRTAVDPPTSTVPLRGPTHERSCLSDNILSSSIHLVHPTA